MESSEQEAGKQNSPPSNDNISGTAALKNPEELLAEGKRCSAAGDANGAVENYQEACAKLVEVYGAVAKELAEPYYLYGRALLDVARAQNTVLGTGIPVPEEKTSSDEEDEQADSTESTESNSPEAAQQSPPEQASSTTGDSGLNNNNTTSNDAPGPSNVTSGDASGPSGIASGDAPGPSGLNEGGKEEDESDLQLAWEMLELARIICQKQDGDEFKLKLADVNLALGEVGLESDQNDQAIGDFRSCLKLREEVLEPTDRRLAEIHFRLGLAYALVKQLDNSIEEYKKSKESLEIRKENLEQELAGKGKEERRTTEDEIKELGELLPDIESKIIDAGDMKKMMEENAKEEEGESSTSIGFADASSTSEAKTIAVKTITDISHLVRKRPADEEVDQSNQAKRRCTEEMKTNGEATSTSGSIEQTAEQ